MALTWFTMRTIILAVLWMNIASSAGEDLFVAPDGEDSNPCTEEKTCKSIAHACDVATSGTHINIRGDQSHAYDIDNIVLQKTLHLKAWKFSPTFKCKSDTDDSCNFDIQPTDSDEANFFNITDIATEDCNFCFNSSSFEVTKSFISGGGILMDLLRDGTYSTQVDSSELQSIEIVYRTSNDDLDHQLAVTVSDTTIQGPDTSLSFHSKEMLFPDLQVSFTNVIFHDMVNPLTFTNFSKLQFTGIGINVFNVTTTSHCMGILFTADNSIGEVIMYDSVFHDNFCNGGGFAFEGGMLETTLDITNCTFMDNTALMAGSGVKILLSPQAEISDSKFYNNFNSESAAALIIGASNVSVTNCDFQNNTVLTGDALIMGEVDDWERKGAGGAVYVSGGSEVLVDNCTFINNSVDWFGGSIASFGNITIQNSYFEHKESGANALGSMMYMTGPTKLENNICNTTSVYMGQAMIWYTSNSRASTLSWVDTGYLELYCPPGSQFYNGTLRASADPDAPFKDFLYACRSCQAGEYSLQQGYRIGSIYNDSPIWSSDFQCLECPYGGQCANGRVTAYENFWGYQVQKGNHKEISFLTCPPGYCCTGDECQSYDSCHAGRYGDICGRCMEGTSELVFATECYPNEECHDYWYFAIDVANAVVFVLMFLYQMEIGTFVATKILGQSPKGQKSGSPSAVNAYIKSFFYFYQTVSLLAVADNRASQVIGLTFQPFIAGILSFSPIAALIVTCPFPNMTPVAKTLLRTTPTVFIYFGLGLCAIGMVIYDKVKAKKLVEARDREYITDVDSSDNVRGLSFSNEETVDSLSDRTSSRTGTTYLSHNFRSRLSRACTNIFLLNYLTISNMTLGMLVCKNVGYKDVLFIDGTMECISGWQSIFIIVSILHTMPFFIAVIASRYLLDDNRISVTEFFLSYVMPLPMLIYWAVVYGGEIWRTRRALTRQGATFVSMVSGTTPDEPDIIFVNTQKDNSIKQEILFIVEDPYLKIGVDRSKSLLYWEGILIFRRLILLMMLVFTTNPLLQMTLQTTTCLIFLVWHMMAQPFRSRAANNVEAVSLSILTVVAVLHTIQATFMSAGRRPSGPNDLQITITDWIEWVLVSLPPLLVVVLIIVLILVRLLRLLFKGLYYIFEKMLGLCGKVPPCKDKREYHDLE